MNVSEKDEIIQSMSMLIKNFENKMDTRLSKIEKEVAQIPEMKSDISTMKSDILKMKDDISGLKREVSQIPEMKKNMAKMQKEIVEIKHDVRKISQSVAVIEVEHGDKLKALFDAFSSNREDIERNKKSIEKLKNLYQLHDDKIYSLESKVQGL